MSRPNSTQRTAFLLIVSAFVVGFLFTLWPSSAVKSSPPELNWVDSRALEVLAVFPEASAEQIQERMAESDAVIESRAKKGLHTNVALLRREMSVSEEELLGLYESNRALFGDRPFEDCRFSLDRLARIEKVRLQLRDQNLSSTLDFRSIRGR